MTKLSRTHATTMSTVHRRRRQQRSTTSSCFSARKTASLLLLAISLDCSWAHRVDHAPQDITTPAKLSSLLDASSPYDHKANDELPVKKAKRAAEFGANKNPTSIPITDTLPSTVDLAATSPTLLSTWNEALSSLSISAEDLVQQVLESSELSSLGGRIRGIPGTGIETDSEAKSLQQHLDCMSSKGEWVLDEQGSKKSARPDAGLTVHKQDGIYASCDKRYYKGKKGDQEAQGSWDVRSSLKWKWVPSPTCAKTAPVNARPGSTLSRRKLCQYLSHKSTLLVGDAPHYSLHDMLLDWATVAPMSCYGDLYCREHSMCGDILKSSPGTGIEDWNEDERVWTHLPLPPALAAARKNGEERTEAIDDSIIAENGKERSPSIGTMLRYRRTDGLKSSNKQVLPTFEHSATGVREMNQQWIADSRRSDIVVMSKSPLPFPLLGHNSTFDSWFAEAEQAEDPVQYAERFIEAAWRITEDVWLPELLDTLKLTRGAPSPPDQLIIYRSGWRSHHDCARSQLDEDDPSTNWEWNSPGDGPPPHIRQPSLTKLIFRDRSKTRLVDRHTLWYNLQTILQNHVVRKFVAPKFGIPFLDLESGMSVWRSGMVGGSASRPFEALSSSDNTGGLVDQSRNSLTSRGAGLGMRSAASGDCSRYCIASPGSGIEEAFIGGLTRIFERGWGSTTERKEAWTGDKYMSVRERVAERKKAQQEAAAAAAGLDDV